MSLVPVLFREAEATVVKPDIGDSFQLPPTAPSVCPPQPGDFADRSTDSDDLDFANLSDDLEIHPETRLSDGAVTGRLLQGSMLNQSGFERLPFTTQVAGCVRVAQNLDFVDTNLVPIPEPSTWLLSLCGIALLAWRRARHR